MNQQRPEKEDLRDSWIESLLWSACNPDDHTERVSAAMDCIEPDVAKVQMVPRRKFWPTRWPALGVAATVLLVLYFALPTNLSSNSAMAAIERSLEVANQPSVRQYLLSMEFQGPGGGTRQIKADLFTHGEDNFVFRYPGRVFGQSVWLGKKGEEAWVVPPFGPVLIGDETIHHRWLRSGSRLGTERGTRKIAGLADMNVNRLLRRVAIGYRLEVIGDEELTVPGDGLVPCQHVRAERRLRNRYGSPDIIEVWMNRQTGMAMQLKAGWELASDAIGKKSMTLTYQGEQSAYTDEWFTAQAHYDGDRRIIQNDPGDD